MENDKAFKEMEAVTIQSMNNYEYIMENDNASENNDFGNTVEIINIKIENDEYDFETEELDNLTDASQFEFQNVKTESFDPLLEEFVASIKSVKTGNYTCKICAKTLTWNNNLRVEEHPLKCEFCCTMFENREDLLTHTQFHTGKCNVCLQIFSWIPIMDYTGKKPYTYTICTLSEFKNSNKVGDNRTVTFFIPFIFVFQFVRSMYNKAARVFNIPDSDVETHAAEDAIQESTSQQFPQASVVEASTSSFPDDFPLNFTQVLEKKLYICKICKKSFWGNHTQENQENVPQKRKICSFCKTHLQTIPKRKLFNCKLCSKSFASLKLLIEHFRIHTGYKPYLCTICDESFDQAGSLKNHMRLHEEENPYKCKHCDKCFASKISLKDHLVTYTGGNQHTCPICDKSFIQNCHLIKHIAMHTGEPVFQCQICGKDFATNRNLKIHYRLHNGENPYSCTVCEKSFPVEQRLKVHMRKHHNVPST